MKKYIIGIIPEQKKGSPYMSLKSNLTELQTRRVITSSQAAAAAWSAAAWSAATWTAATWTAATWTAATWTAATWTAAAWLGAWSRAWSKLNQIKLFLLPIMRWVRYGPCTRWEDGGRPNIISVEPLHHLHCFSSFMRSMASPIS